MKKYIAFIVAIIVMSQATVHPWFWSSDDKTEKDGKSKWLVSKRKKRDWKKLREERKKRREARRKKFMVEPCPEKICKEGDGTPEVKIKNHERKRERSLGHDIAVKDVSSQKPDAFRVDLNITSTVPVNVEVKDDRLVVQQVSDGKILGGKRVSSGKVVSMDMKEIGQSGRIPLYKVPSWPEYVMCFEDKDRVSAYLQYQYAGNSYSSSGHSQDMSKLVFGECPIRIREILLASKLAEAGKVTDNSGGGTVAQNYLGYSAPLELCFDASIDDLRFSLGYARHFRNNDISLGFHVPIVMRKHSLKLTTTCGSAAIDKTKFEERYKKCSGDYVKEFIKDILAKKDIALTEHDTEIGIGDVSAFINFEFDSSVFERLFAGLRVLFPTARGRDIHKLWSPELGNGGFTEASAFGSLLYSYNDWFNPHAMLSATYCFAADVPRRVPSYKEYKYSAPAGVHLGDLLVMGEYVQNKADTDFKELDTTIRRFATETINIRIRKGAELFFRFGNMIERLFCDKAFLDFFYDLRLKGEDYINKKNLDCKFYPKVLEKNTYQVEHRVGFNLSYQFCCRARFMIGGMYSIAGRNIPKTLEGNASLHFEF